MCPQIKETPGSRWERILLTVPDSDDAYPAIDVEQDDEIKAEEEQKTNTFFQSDNKSEPHVEGDATDKVYLK